MHGKWSPPSLLTTREARPLRFYVNLPKELVAKRTCSLAPSHHHFAKIIWFDFFIFVFSLTVFRRFHEKWRETTLKNSEIFWHRVKSHLLSFVCILPKECCRPLPRCQKISLFLIVFSRHFPWKRRKTVRRNHDQKISQPRIWFTLNPLTYKVG